MIDHSLSRGQFISLGALVLLVVLIGGVEVAYQGVESYDDRLTGPSKQQQVEEPVEEIADSLTVILTDINHDPSVGDADRQSDMTTAFSAQVQTHNPRKSATVLRDIDNIQYEEGTRIVQTDASANYTAEGDQANYNVFSGATDTRQFVVTFHDLLNMPNSTEDHPTFDITTSSGTKTAEVYFADTSPNVDEIVIEVDGTVECSQTPDLNEGVARVDLLRGSIDGEPCDDYEITNPVTAVRFENGDTATGTFSLTFWGDPSDRNTGAIPTEQNTPPSFGGASNPVAHDVVYAAVVDITAVEEGSGITRTAIIAPGDLHTQLD